MYRHNPAQTVLTPINGNQEHNPFANFTSNTYPMIQNNGLNDYGQAFQSNQPMIEKTNFRNQNNVLHNNLHSNLLSEHISEYKLCIDSKDRNISYYLDPFKFNVDLAPSATSGANGSSYNLPPQPSLPRSFRNVKYIKLDTAILPKYYGITYDMGEGEWILDTTKDLTKDRFVSLKLKNFTSSKMMATNGLTDHDTVTLIPDKTPTNSNFYYATTTNLSNTIMVYDDSQLGNLTKFYVEFYDSTGTQLAYTGLDAEQPITDVRNPLNINLQPYLIFSVGVVENELSTETTYVR